MDASVCNDCGATYTATECPQCNFDVTTVSLKGLRQSVDMALVEVQRLRTNVDNALIGLEALLKIIHSKLEETE